MSAQDPDQSNNPAAPEPPEPPRVSLTREDRHILLESMALLGGVRGDLPTFLQNLRRVRGAFRSMTPAEWQEFTQRAVEGGQNIVPGNDDESEPERHEGSDDNDSDDDSDENDDADYDVDIPLDPEDADADDLHDDEMETITADVTIPSSPPSFKERLAHLPRHEEVMWHRIRAYFTSYATADSMPYTLCYICQDAELKLGWLPPTGTNSFPLKDAVYFACGHMVCRECAAGLYRTQEFLRCPACRHALYHAVCGHNVRGQDLSIPELVSHTAWFQKTLEYRTPTVPEGGQVPDQCVPCRFRAARTGAKRRSQQIVGIVPEMILDGEQRRQLRAQLTGMLRGLAARLMRDAVVDELPLWGRDWHWGMGTYNADAPFPWAPWDAWTRVGEENKGRMVRRFLRRLNSEFEAAEEVDEDGEVEVEA
ncbi:hypothetical protein B0T22DRAFT_479979 [Podospora appendiculata]|uniref:RING-type domain-containing protein n=1 Tax=Podospora appendiculata TaxID=314037 RepID=A0AAE1CCL1_9PEZI|nr:hypothetical protein B0T22DRAFT_479979 [Podospora appendiculata]